MPALPLSRGPRESILAQADVPAIAPVHAGAASVVAWMLHEGRANTHMRVRRRLVPALGRGGDSFVARLLRDSHAPSADRCKRVCLAPRRNGAERRTAEHGIEKTPAFAQSPLTKVTETGRAIRRRLDDLAVKLDYAILEAFRAEGGTDYVAMPMVFSSGEIN
jgi:hypothetical protein